MFVDFLAYLIIQVVEGIAWVFLYLHAAINQLVSPSWQMILLGIVLFVAALWTKKSDTSKEPTP